MGSKAFQTTNFILLNEVTPLESFRRKISKLQLGQEVECAAIESKSSTQMKLDIPCVGKLEDGRIVLFDKRSSLSKVIKLGDKIKGKVVVVKPSFVIIEPESIVEQGVQFCEDGEKEAVDSKWDSSLIVSIRREKEKQKSPDLDRALKLISKALYGEKTHLGSLRSAHTHSLLQISRVSIRTSLRFRLRVCNGQIL
jgi:hypothetical protein